MADDLNSLLAQLGIGGSSGATGYRWVNGQLVDQDGNPAPAVPLSTQGLQGTQAQVPQVSTEDPSALTQAGLPPQLPQPTTARTMGTPQADDQAPPPAPMNGRSVAASLPQKSSPTYAQPSIDPASLPQQSGPGGIVGELGNVVLAPLHILNAFGTAVSNSPRVIAQNNELRDIQIQKERLGLSQTQALMDLSRRAAGLLSGDNSAPPPGPQSQQGGALPQPPALQQLAPFMPPPPANDASGSAAAPNAPRGMRNQNPGNVRALPNGQMWQGQTGTDPNGYAQFGTMADGIRAALVNLHSYGAKDGLNTVQDVINRWSPGAPAGYAQYVAQQVGVRPTDKINLSDPNTLRSVAQGIFSFENGPATWQGYQSGNVAARGAQTTAASTGPASQLPQIGDAPTVAPSRVNPASLPQVGQPTSSRVGLSDNGRRGLATLAIMSGQPDQAASIMSGDVVPDSSGNLVDHKTGSVLGRVPTYSYVNGYRVDAGDPNAPNFIPTLPSGTMPDGRGGVVSIPGAVNASRSASFAEQAGKNDANWPGDNVTVTGPDGRPYTMSRSQFAAMTSGQGAQSGLGGGGRGAGQRLGGGPGNRGLPGIPGVSGGQDEFTKDQAKDASDTLSGDMSARSEALQDLDNSRQALSYVQSHGNSMNPTTPYLVAGANYLRSLPPDVLKAVGVNPAKPEQSANDAGVYQRLSSEDLLTFSKGHLPSRYTEREMAVAGRVIPGLATAPDAATFHWGLQAAVANKTLQRADFSANYQGPPSRQSIEQAWNSTPAGQASLFEDPIWQGLKIGGKPAVVYTRDPRTGRTVGVVGMGTSAPTTFYPSGVR